MASLDQVPDKPEAIPRILRMLDILLKTGIGSLEIGSLFTDVSEKDCRIVALEVLSWWPEFDLRVFRHMKLDEALRGDEDWVLMGLTFDDFLYATGVPEDEYVEVSKKSFVGMGQEKLGRLLGMLLRGDAKIEPEAFLYMKVR